MNIRNYKIEFSKIGFIAVVIPLIPNIFWALLPPVNNTMTGNSSQLPMVEVIGSICRILMLVLLVMIVNKEQNKQNGFFLRRIISFVAIICLLGYLISWVIYYFGTVTPLLLLGMAIMPTIYLICVGIYLRNYIAVVPAVIFAVIHIVTTAQNYL